MRTVTEPMTAGAPRWGTALLLAVVVVGVGVRLALLPKELARTPDERVYARQAETVKGQGVHGFIVLGEELHAAPAAVAMYPSPLRAGWIVLLTGFTALTEESPMAAGSGLSFVCSVATLLLLAWIGVRFFSTAAAVCSTLLLAVFPFDLVVYQRAWQESFCSLLGLATVAVMLAAATAHGRARRLLLGGFTVLGVGAFAVKENSAMLFLLCGVELVLHFWMRQERRWAGFAGLAVTVAAVVSMVLLGSVFGGPFHFVALYREFARFWGANPYLAQYEAGPGWWMAAGMWQASRMQCAGFVMGLVLAVWRAWQQRDVRNTEMALAYGAVIVFTLGFPLMTALNFRFVAPVFGVLCLLAGAGAIEMLRTATKRFSLMGRRVALVAMGVLLTWGAVRDLRFARAEFLERGVPDLAVRMVRGMGPAS